jgi:hypothetical protein
MFGNELFLNIPCVYICWRDSLLIFSVINMLIFHTKYKFGDWVSYARRNQRMPFLSAIGLIFPILSGLFYDPLVGRAARQQEEEGLFTHSFACSLTTWPEI